MNRARNQILAHTAFASEQHGGISGSHSLHRGQNLLHLRAARDNVGMRIAFAQCLAESPVLFPEIAHVQFLMDDDAHFRQGERLEHVIAGPRLHGLHGSFDAAKSGHDHHGQRGILPFHRLQKLQPVHAGELQVGEDQIDGILAQQFESGLRVLGRVRAEPVLPKVQLKQPPHLGLILHNEDAAPHLLHLL